EDLLGVDLEKLLVLRIARLKAQPQAAGREVLHDVVRLGRGPVYLQDMDDVLVAHFDADVGFVKELPPVHAAFGVLGMQEFHCEVAATRRLHDLEHLRHLPRRPKLASDPVASNDLFRHHLPSLHSPSLSFTNTLRSECSLSPSSSHCPP